MCRQRLANLLKREFAQSSIKAQFSITIHIQPCVYGIIRVHQRVLPYVFLQTFLFQPYLIQCLRRIIDNEMISLTGIQKYYHFSSLGIYTDLNIWLILQFIRVHNDKP